MKASYYNLFFPFDGKKYILFNTLRGSILLVDSDVKYLIERNEISSIDEQYTNIFEDNGIIVDENLNEIDMMKVKYGKTKYNTSLTYLHVITTYRCNLSCTYCYEGKGELVSESMDKKTGNCVIKFIKELASSDNSNRLAIELFGGEPLLNMPMNLLIAKNLSEWCKESNKDFHLNAITNGTLLTSGNMEELAEYNCTFLVTLDGPKEIHDKRRMYKNKKGTFDDIIDGLHRAADRKLRVTIRINVDETNKDSIVSLLEFLRDNDLNRVKISIKPVFNTSPACMSYEYCMPREIDLKVRYQLGNVARKMNFGVDQPENPSPDICLAQKISYFTVDPYLRLFKCPLFPPFEKNSVGTINIENSKPIFNHLNIDFLSRDPLDLEECRNCELLPLCRGGCSAKVFETMGTSHGNACNKSGYYAFLKENLLNLMRKDT